MKKSYILGALVLAGMSLTGCNDFLDDNRYPLSKQTVNADFWNNANNVQSQVNYFYEDFAGYGNGSSTNGTFYYSWLSDDQCGRNSFSQWKYTAVPASSSAWNAPYVEIRRANLVIEGLSSEKNTLSTAERENFLGIARMYRARGYYDLVRRFGNVPLVTKPLDPSSEAELFGERTNRNEVMDFVLEDLNYAIEHISTKSDRTKFSSDMVQAFKAEICLYEGSYARYHQGDKTRAEKYFKEVVSAGEAIIANYPVGEDYLALYKSVKGGAGGHISLDTNPEVIFCKMYLQGTFMHSLQDYSNASDGVAGLTRDAFDSYLFRDGLTAEKTSYDTTDKGTVTEDGSGLDLSAVLAVRDQRLAMTTYDHVMMPGMAYTASNTQAMQSESGYGVAKFNNFSVSQDDVNTANKNYICAPLFWGARLALAIVEAKAELSEISDPGAITDADVAKYIKPLWDRAGIDTSNLNLAWLKNMNDPENNMDVKSLIWEIRRCRRCELIMDDDIRYWDLIRWKQLDKLDTTKYPKIIQGANVSNAPVAASSMIGDYLNCSYGNSRKFEEKHYLYPIPSDQISLNEKLKPNNPGW